MDCFLQTDTISANEQIVPIVCVRYPLFCLSIMTRPMPLELTLWAEAYFAFKANTLSMQGHLHGSCKVSWNRLTTPPDIQN